MSEIADRLEREQKQRMSVVTVTDRQGPSPEMSGSGGAGAGGTWSPAEAALTEAIASLRESERLLLEFFPVAQAAQSRLGEQERLISTLWDALIAAPRPDAHIVNTRGYRRWFNEERTAAVVAAEKASQQ